MFISLQKRFCYTHASIRHCKVKLMKTTVTTTSLTVGKHQRTSFHDSNTIDATTKNVPIHREHIPILGRWVAVLGAPRIGWGSWGARFLFVSFIFMFFFISFWYALHTWKAMWKSKDIKTSTLVNIVKWSGTWFIQHCLWDKLHVNLDTLYVFYLQLSEGESETSPEWMRLLLNKCKSGVYLHILTIMS